MQKRSFLALVCVILLIIAAHYVGWLNPVESFFRKLLNPGSNMVYQWSVIINEKKEDFKNVKDLEDAYKKIKEKYLTALVEEAKYQMLAEENKQLRQQLNFFQRTKYNLIGALVIGKSIDSLRNSIVIDHGEKDGIKIGLPVTSENGILIGKVIMIDKNTSIVQLLNDQQSKIAATIMNKDKSMGIVEGGYGLSIQMNFIPQNENLPIGETIITSGLEKGIPYGLIIGTVDAVEKEAYQPFQKAVISPLLDLEKIRIVSVILNYEN